MIQISGTQKELREFIWTMAVAYECIGSYEKQRGSKNLSPVKERLEAFAANATEGIQEMEEMKKEKVPDFLSSLSEGEEF